MIKGFLSDLRGAQQGFRMYWSAGRTLRKFPNTETGLDGNIAIDFALTIDDHYDMREFLNSWCHGDLSEWADYVQFRKVYCNDALAKQRGEDE